jgi:hypothetical protein
MTNNPDNTALTPTNQPMPAELLDQSAQDAGRGVSSRPEDQLIPLIYVLQNGSPACDRRAATFIEGAEPGHFMLRGAVEPIRDGRTGIIAIPCNMVRCWLEWLPGRQGLVGRHNKPPGDIEIKTIRDGGYERQSLVRSTNNNLVQDTREFYLLVDGAPYMLPCYGSRHTFAREWQTFFQNFRPPRTPDVMPSFARKYRLHTVPAANAMGHWFTVKFEDRGYVSTAEYTEARALNDIVERGAQRAELPVDDGAVAGPGPGLHQVPPAA